MCYISPSSTIHYNNKLSENAIVSIQTNFTNYYITEKYLESDLPTSLMLNGNILIMYGLFLKPEFSKNYIHNHLTFLNFYGIRNESGFFLAGSRQGKNRKI